MKSAAWKSNWDMVEPLDKGGQGKTYTVRNKTTGQLAVLKELRYQDSKLARERMFQEVNALRTLTQKKAKVPAVFETNVDKSENISEELYFVMEKIDGTLLREFVTQKGPLALPSAVESLTDIALTVKLAHDNNIFHRDLKPANIMVRNDNPSDCVLLDFGLSFNKLDPMDLTGSGEQIWSEFIELPELTVRNGNKRRPTSDVTMACGLFYYLLTGHYPSLLRDENGRAPHRRDGRDLDATKLTPRQMYALDLLFERGFTHTIEDRFQSVEDLLARVNHASETEDHADFEDPITIAKRATLELRAGNKEIHAAAFAQSINHIWGRIQTILIQINPSLGDFMVATDSSGVDLRNMPSLTSLYPISSTLYSLRVVIKSQQHRNVSFGYLFALDATQCVVLRTDLVTTYPPQLFANINSLPKLHPIQHYITNEPTDEKLADLLRDCKRNIGLAIDTLKRSTLTPSK